MPYTLQYADLGAVPEPVRSELASGVLRVSLLLGAIAAAGGALAGGLAAKKSRGKVAALAAVGAGLPTLGVALLLGRYGLKRADVAYDMMAAAETVTGWFEKLPLPGGTS